MDALVFLAGWQRIVGGDSPLRNDTNLALSMDFRVWVDMGKWVWYNGVNNNYPKEGQVWNWGSC